MTFLKEAFIQKCCSQEADPTSHTWLHHLLDGLTVKSYVPGRVRFHLKFKGDDILIDFLRRELHKLDGCQFRRYSSRTGSLLVTYDSLKLRLEQVAEAVYDGCAKFGEAHAECEIGEQHQHLSDSQPHHDCGGHHHHDNVEAHNHNDEDCGHDHSHLQSSEGVARETAKIVLTGIMLSGVVILRIMGRRKVVSTELMLFSSLVTVAAGYPIFQGGAKTLQKGKRFTDDTLISIAVIASLIMKESITGLSVVWLINIGRLMETLTVRRSKEAIKDLLDLAPNEAWLVTGDTVKNVKVESIKKGDIVRIHASEKLPLDGFVVKGTGSVKEALLTGEPLPKDKRENDFVYAGTLLEAGTLEICIENTHDETAVARMIRSVEQLRSQKAPIEMFGQKFVTKFVPVSLATSVILFLITKDWRRAITALVIACPCAAGLATPTAVSAAVGRAARRGILIKGGNHLEVAAHVDTVVFDKTGTLTEGTPSLDRVMLFGDQNEDELLCLAARAEQHSTHPAGQVLLYEAKARGLDIGPVDDYEAFPGRGMMGTVNGQKVLCGNLLFLKENVKLNSAHEAFIEESVKHPGPVVYQAVDNELRGIYLLSDKLRAECHQALSRLKSLGIFDIYILSGDKQNSVDNVGQILGIENVKGNLLPYEKRDFVKSLMDKGRRVLMVGDGVNDAEALVGCDLSMAMVSSRCDLAIEAADITLSRDDLTAVSEAIMISRKTLTTIKTNFFASVAVNGLGLMAGAIGRLNPLQAAVVHNLSTLVVVANSTLLSRNIKFIQKEEEDL